MYSVSVGVKDVVEAETSFRHTSIRFGDLGFGSGIFMETLPCPPPVLYVESIIF